MRNVILCALVSVLGGVRLSLGPAQTPARGGAPQSGAVQRDESPLGAKGGCAIGILKADPRVDPKMVVRTKEKVDVGMELQAPCKD